MLYEMIYNEDADIIQVMVWKGVPADPKKQRPMFNWYDHCSNLCKLKTQDKGLYQQRLITIKKWFAKKDSSHANIYRHYYELER